MSTKDNKKTESSNDFYTLLPAVLDEIIEAIEQYETIIDGEWGSCRSTEELVRLGFMPELYNRLVALKNGR